MPSDGGHIITIRKGAVTSPFARFGTNDLQFGSELLEHVREVSLGSLPVIPLERLDNPLEHHEEEVGASRANVLIEGYVVSVACDFAVGIGSAVEPA